MRAPVAKRWAAFAEKVYDMVLAAEETQRREEAALLEREEAERVARLENARRAPPRRVSVFWRALSPPTGFAAAAGRGAETAAAVRRERVWVVVSEPANLRGPPDVLRDRRR